MGLLDRIDRFNEDGLGYRPSITGPSASFSRTGDKSRSQLNGQERPSAPVSFTQPVTQALTHSGQQERTNPIVRGALSPNTLRERLLIAASELGVEPLAGMPGFQGHYASMLNDYSDNANNLANNLAKRYGISSLDLLNVIGPEIAEDEARVSALLNKIDLSVEPDYKSAVTAGPAKPVVSALPIQPVQTRSQRFAGQRLPEIVNAYDEVRALAAQLGGSVPHIQGLDLITAGNLTARMLEGEQYAPLLQSLISRDKTTGTAYASIAAANGVSPDVLNSAIAKYAQPNNLVAHYRSPAASPAQMTKTGLYLTALDDGLFRAESVVSGNPRDEGREIYGNGLGGRERHAIETWDRNQLLSELASRENYGWYSAFVDPHAQAEFRLPSLAYDPAASQDIVSWRERRQRGY